MFISLAAAARQCGVAYGTMQTEARAGRLAAIETGCGFLVTQADLDTWKLAHLARVERNRFVKRPRATRVAA